MKKNWKKILAYISASWLLYSVIREFANKRTFLRKIVESFNLELTNIKLWHIIYPLFLFIITLLIIRNSIKRQKSLDLGSACYFNAHWFINRKAKKVDPNPLCLCCNPPKRLLHFGGAYTTPEDGERKKHPLFKCPQTNQQHQLRSGTDDFLTVEEAVELINEKEFPNNTREG